MSMATIQNFKQNYLSPIEFRFVINRLPYVSFFTQRASLPGISMNPASQPNPFKMLYHSPDTMTYDQLTVEFRVDENMKNYDEIYNWMIGLAFPDRFPQFADLKESDAGLYSDATFLIMSNGRNPNIEYKFKNIFPISLTSIDLDTTSGDVNYITASVTFQIESYEITTGNNS